jgi:hypothetical protein
VKGAGAAATLAAAVTAANAHLTFVTSQSPPRRYLSCIQFSAYAPVLLVGTSDGSIELFRVEGTALTSTPPPHSPSAAPQFDINCYGQELNALTVSQVPRDRPSNIDTQLNGVSTSPSHSSSLADFDRMIQVQQENLARFKEQARKLESIMESHVDSKSEFHPHANATHEC